MGSCVSVKLSEYHEKHKLKKMIKLYKKYGENQISTDEIKELNFKYNLKN